MPKKGAGDVRNLRTKPTEDVLYENNIVIIARLMNPENKKSSPAVTVIVVLGLLAMLAGVVFWVVIKPQLTQVGSSSEHGLPKDIASAYIPGGRPLAGIRLIDHNGQPFTEQRFKGKWTFMFFGYTHCPDVCPTTMLIMKAVWARLPEAAKQAPEPQMLFVSVDPDRDTPEILKSYATFYNPEFLGVTAKHKYLDILTKQVGALYGYDDGVNEGEYTVNHSAQLVLIDPDGRFRAVFSPPLAVDDIVRTFPAIREYYQRVDK
jgi:protein SCO1/2